MVNEYKCNQLSIKNFFDVLLMVCVLKKWKERKIEQYRWLGYTHPLLGTNESRRVQPVGSVENAYN